MATIKIYGCSDDLIEIEGDICEEFCLGFDEDHKFLGFSDGTILQIVYSDSGIWRIFPIICGTAKYSKKEGLDSNDDYSDEVTLTGDIKWVVCGTEMAKNFAIFSVKK